MQTVQQQDCGQEKQAQRYQPNEELLTALRDLKQETTEQSDYFRGQLEATFQQR